jgi:hypothetical protein
MIEFQQQEQWYESHVTDATDQAFAKMVNAPPFAVFYLHVHPATETEKGRLAAYQDGEEPKGVELLTGERINSAWTRSQIRAFIHRTGRRAPLYPTYQV